MDYRRLNVGTKKHKFLIPIVDELLDELGVSHFFSKLDLRANYRQILMAHEEINKTSLQTHQGQFEFNVNAYWAFECPFYISG